MPAELSFGEIYLPPLLVVLALAVVAAWGTASVMNRLRLSRYICAPTLVFISITALYTVLIGTIAIPI